MGDCFRTAEVYVRGFPAHVVEQPGLVLFLGEEESTHRLEKRSAFLKANQGRDDFWCSSLPILVPVTTYLAHL